VEERRQREVGGAHLVAYSLVSPGGLGPVAVQVSGADHDSGGITAVSEAAAERGMHADVHQRSTGAQDPRCFPQDRWVAGHVGVHHHRDDGRDAATGDWQPSCVGQHHAKAVPGMPEHSGGQVHAHRAPAQRPDLCGAHPGAAADLQADAAARAQELPQGMLDARTSAPAAAVLARNSSSYQSAISSYAAAGAIGDASLPFHSCST